MRKSFKMCAAIISGVLAVNVFLPCVNASAGSDSSAVIEGTYNFASNAFRILEPHNECDHNIKEVAPSYYSENIQLLKDKSYITDIQLVRVDD